MKRVKKPFAPICCANVHFGYINLSQTFPEAIPMRLDWRYQILCLKEDFVKLEAMAAPIALVQGRRPVMAMYLNSILHLVNADWFFDVTESGARNVKLPIDFGDMNGWRQGVTFTATRMKMTPSDTYKSILIRFS